NPHQPLKGQVEDLLDIPIAHPAFGQATVHTSVLVTTGLLDETLRQTIEGFNQGRRTQSKSTLDVWVKGQLQSKLQNAIGRFLPANLANIRDFLQLWLADGRSGAAKPDIASFLESRVQNLTSTASA